MTKRDELERATRELRRYIEDWARAHGLTPHEQVHAVTRACSRHIEFITEPLIREEELTTAPDDILQRLRALGVCGGAVRPADHPEGSGWVVAYLEDHEPDLHDLWQHAVAHHPFDAWWLAGKLGVARPAVDRALRRALVYAADAAEAAGLDGSELRRVAAAEALDYEAADAACAAVGAAWSAWAATRDAVRAAARTAEAAGAAGAAAEATAELDKQREDLLALWPEVERAFRAVEVGA